MKTQLTGKKGEAEAAVYLRKKGYDILEANFHTRYGEIDLIAKKREIVVFAEVKTRKDGRFANAFEAVDRIKQEKIKTCAASWLAQNDPGSFLQARFDVFEVYLQSEERVTVNHIENAF
ncbi:MAG: YraN family protein [Bacillota bacterium]|nr:YraN family protein [Bacillota bacterium]